MSSPPHTEFVARWLVQLTQITAVSMPHEELRARIAAMAPLMAEDWPAAAFTHASLKHVAGACRFFPAYAELSQALGAWWKDNRPLPPPLPPPAPKAPPEPPDEAAIEAARREVAAVVAELTATAEARAQAARPAPPETRPAHFSDEQLLALYEQLAAEGNAPARTRLAMLRQKLGKKG